jgi:hypothetical protein
MSLTLRSILAAVALAVASPAAAQLTIDPAGDIFSQGLVAPSLEQPAQTLAVPKGDRPAAGNALAGGTPAASPSGGGSTLNNGPRYDLLLEALLVKDTPPLREGVIWRVFLPQPDADGELPLVVETKAGGTADVRLPSGDYLVHAAFGRAGATKRVTISGRNQRESVVLDAGGLELDSEVGEGRAIPPDRLSFEVMQENQNGDYVTVVPHADAHRVIRLSAGTYHVVSRYGNVNAVVRADIEVEAGKLTEATMRHTGAEVTLKLVSEEGGEAIANTNWTVTTQDGLTVHESIGAFPSIVLAAGNYTAIAKHQGEIYSRDFKVEPGIERDIEVRLADLVKPDASGPGRSPTGRRYTPNE